MRSRSQVSGRVWPRSTIRSRISDVEDQKPEAQRPSPRVGHPDEGPGRGPAVVHDVRTEDPRVAASDARLPAGVNGDRPFDFHGAEEDIVK